jgi:hypothetical protein
MPSVFALFFFVAASPAELYRRAPDVLPGTLPEMRTAAYWVARMAKPDEVILDPAAIEHMNRAYEERVRSRDPFGGIARERVPDLTYWWPGFVLATPDFRQMSGAELAALARERIKLQVQYLRKQPWGNALGVEFAPWELERLEREMDAARIPDFIVPQRALVVRTSRLRNVPAYEPGAAAVRETGKSRWEAWNVCLLRIATPVTVLHVSRAGEWLLVATGDAYGWAPSEDVAFGTDKEIAAFANPANFVVATGDRVPFYSDPACRYASGHLRLGDRAPRAAEGRIKVPARWAGGRLAAAEAFLREDAAVHHGWLPYTRRNIVITALQLLDNMYDWSGAWLGRQHENTYRDIFAVFGFRLPWNGELFTIFGRNETVLPPGIPREEGIRAVLRNEPFVTLQASGNHAQLLLGEYEGRPITLDQHGYGYKDENGVDVEVRRCHINDLRLPAYFFKRKVTFLELR